MKKLLYLIVSFLFFACNDNTAQNETKDSKPQPTVKTEKVKAEFDLDNLDLTKYLPEGAQYRAEDPEFLKIAEKHVASEIEKRKGYKISSSFIYDFMYDVHVSAFLKDSKLEGKWKTDLSGGHKIEIFKDKNNKFLLRKTLTDGSTETYHVRKSEEDGRFFYRKDNDHGYDDYGNAYALEPDSTMTAQHASGKKYPMYITKYIIS